MGVPSQHWSFFSPNQEEGLNLEQASQRLRSSNHQAWKKIADEIIQSLGLHHQTRSHDAIGAWFDESGHHYSENSLMHAIEGQHDPKVIQYLAHWLGLLGNQKAVITFHSGKDGPDYLYQVHTPETSAQKVVESLKRHGILYHTIVPRKKGHSVVVWDQGRQNKSAIEKFAQEHNARVLATPGVGEYTGESSRPQARALYRTKIKEFEAARSQGQGAPAPEASHPGPSRTPAQDLPPAVTRQAFRRRGLVIRKRRKGAWVHYQAGIHSPRGGMIVRGQFFRGGEFIPGSMLEGDSNRDGKQDAIGSGPNPNPNQTQSPPNGQPSRQPKVPESKPQEPKSRASSILSGVGKVPAKALGKAKSAISSVWKKYEKRYGRRWAMAIVGAAIVGIPIPVPGSMVMTTAAAVGMAELYLKIKGRPLEKVEKSAGFDLAELSRLGRQFLNEVFARLGLERNQISQTA